MKVDLVGRIALVTGAASGIGRSIALAFAQNGARIAVNDIKPGERTCEEIRELGGQATFFPARRFGRRRRQRHDRQHQARDGTYRCAGEQRRSKRGKEPGSTHVFPDEEWHRIIRVDLDGVFYCSRAVSAAMIKRRKGAIINIGSAFGVVPARLQCAFTAAKAGVLNFTKSHALEVGQYGVRVNGIAPGSILTEGTRTLFYNPESKQKADSLISHIPLGRPGETDDVAAAALYLASDDAKYVTGHVLVVDGGWTAGFARDW